MDKKAEYQAYCDWAFKKEGEAIGRMDGNDAGWAGWEARALLAAGASEGQAEPIYQCMVTDDDETGKTGARDLWMDVPKKVFEDLSNRTDVRSRIVYAHPSAEIAALRERIAEKTAQVDDLRMLVQRLVHSLNKASPGNDLGAKALDYLMRNGLGASLLREDSESRERIAGMEKDAGWISVEHRLPEFGHFVLIAFADGGVDMSSRIRLKRKDGWFWEGVSKTHHEPPTHWMMLPSAPASSVANKEEPTS